MATVEIPPSGSALVAMTGTTGEPNAKGWEPRMRSPPLRLLIVFTYQGEELVSALIADALLVISLCSYSQSINYRNLELDY